MCSQNKNFGVTLVNGMEVSIKDHEGAYPGTGNLQMAINSASSNKVSGRSDWALHGYTIWDRHLNRQEITAASNAYVNLLKKGATESIRMRT